MVYRLKRHYGVAATLRQSATNTTNHETGVKSRTADDQDITRAILLNTKQAKAILESENENFDYGAVFTSDARLVIIDDADLASGTTITTKDYIVIGGETYNIGQAIEVMDGRVWLLEVTKFEGQR